MTFRVIPTDLGAAKIAAAIAADEQLAITQMAFGDGGGSETTPEPTQTELVNEVCRTTLNLLQKDHETENQFIAEGVIPPEIGGWFVREIGLFDDEGDLIYVANFPSTYKPATHENSRRDLVVRLHCAITSTDAVELIVDPSVVVASRAWVFENFIHAPGGTTGQVLRKRSDDDNDVEWFDFSLPDGASAIGTDTGLNVQQLFNQVHFTFPCAIAKSDPDGTSMQEARWLRAGMYIYCVEHTTGYGHDGGNLYQIVPAGTGVHDNGSFIDLNNGLQAMGVFPNGVGVKQFGAGAGDMAIDQPAFEAALAFSKNVKINANTVPYVLDRLDVPSYTTLYGVGDESKILLAPGDKGDTDTTPAAALRIVGKTGVRLKDFYVDGNKANVSGTNSRNIECINFDSCTDCRAYRIKTVNALADGIDWDDCTNCRAIDCYGEDCGGFAVHISTGSTDCKTIRCEAVNCGHDVSRGGFDVYSTASNSFIEDCVTRACYVGVVVGAGGSSVTNHTSEGDINGGIVLSGTGARAVGGVIRNTEGNGLRMEATRTSASDVQVYGCTNGVRVTDEDCSLVGVRSRNNSGHGISIAPSVTNVHAVGCVTTGNAEGSSNAPSKIQGAGNVP